MPNKIKPKRSYTTGAVPTTSDLEANELAINWADGKAYTKNSSGNIVSATLGGSGGSGSVVTAATVAGFPATGASGTLYLATDTSRAYQWVGAYVELGVSGGGTDVELRALFIPAAPTSVTATGGNAQVSLTWSAPTVLSVTPITDYTVQFSSNSGSTWATFTRGAASTATSATVTGLTNGTAYTFRVAAVNGVGTGNYSTATSAVTPVAGTAPNAPTSFTATAGNAQIALSWTAPSAPGTYAITSYTVEYTPSGGSAQTVSTGGTGTSYTLTGLTNGTAYAVRVAAVSASGTGTFTASSSVTPAVPSLSATLTSGGGANSWRWFNDGSYSDSLIFFGRGDDNVVQNAGWRTTFTPASKPTTINSAIFTLSYMWYSPSGAFTAVLQGAKLANAGQGIQGTSPTTASATGSVSAAASTGTLTIDCTAVIAEIIGQSGWNPGNSIVLYLLGDNAAIDRCIGGNPSADTAGSLVITYA